MLFQDIFGENIIPKCGLQNYNLKLNGETSKSGNGKHYIKKTNLKQVDNFKNPKDFYILIK